MVLVCLHCSGVVLLDLERREDQRNRGLLDDWVSRVAETSVKKGQQPVHEILLLGWKESVARRALLSGRWFVRAGVVCYRFRVIVHVSVNVGSVRRLSSVLG